MNPEMLNRLRAFLKDDIRQQTDFRKTEQAQGHPPPPIQEVCPPDPRRIELPPVGKWPSVKRLPVEKAIENRKSRRHFSPQSLPLDALAFLLWATQGIRCRLDAGTALRTVPSAGARHAFETYLAVLRVESLDPAIYRYLPLEHQLVHARAEDNLPDRLTDATLGQRFSGQAAVTFVWVAIPRRMEWRYGYAAHKVIALDAGHVCQNLYLACEAVGAGTCAIAAYDQPAMDHLVGVDGKDAFTVYLAPVGIKEFE